jgi:hypothetical protein
MAVAPFQGSDGRRLRPACTLEDDERKGGIE